ncbi:phosphoenolpyruvate--protein phosphotransferase [Planctomicrobium piriforme]|uniref:Phosphoenolpyruvate-protein phosphotransferase n=1 Tax=Planctomicrobium piriforme TaxID=1576369 RepID=A0A1I3SJF2_9PLAN|nr:phosphoenolpyruvate--protein phosphotransferase [Planctomicrobium piriforme]SFJ57849.1 phosphotransferase system, enzyme I, PtsI [Planctomicrobium piriforme]
MHVKNGIAVSPGIAIGPAFVLGVEDFRVPQNYVSVAAADSEITRLRCALDNVAAEISANEALAAQHLGKEYAAIFGAHLQFVRDPKLVAEMEQRIRTLHHSPEFAATQVLRRFARELQHLGNQYLAERATDIFDLERSLLRHLLGEQREELSHLTTSVIVLAHNLTPSETANLNRKFVRGFVTEVGGSTSHTAILAGALEIPAIVGVGSFLTDIAGGDLIIVDGDQGKIIINPDDQTIALYQAAQARSRTNTASLQARTDVPAETRDGTRIAVYGNIEFPDEAEHCRTRGADGIGLYRTEFLYLGATRERSEEDHFEAYSKVIRNFPNQPVVIRTLDLGADKVPGALQEVFRDITNPELGLRSIRVSLEYLGLFRTQLRAILRAATEGDVRIMFPLISSLAELRQAKMVLADVLEDLEEQGIPFRRDVPVGMMVEVPSVALLAEEFAREVDFFSVGTNDLIQYVLAADRSDPSVAKYYNAADPAILLLLRRIFAAGAKVGIPVSVCGQMASDPKFVPLLIGMGLRQLSVTPQSIPTIKEMIRNMTLAEAEDIANRASSMELARDVEFFLRGELRRFLPDGQA